MIKAHRGEFNVDSAEVDAAVKALAEALQQTPYEPTRAEEALVLLQDQAQVMITRGRAVTMQVLAALTPAERQQLASRLETKLGQ